MQRLGCLVGSVWGNQHLCMQRQDSSQATSTLGNAPNLNIGSYDGDLSILITPLYMTLTMILYENMKLIEHVVLHPICVLYLMCTCKQCNVKLSLYY